MTENEDVLVSVRNGVGILTLNRPKAINSLNDAMVAGMSEALHAWENDEAVHTVLLTGSGERGLCAGGDVVALYHSAREGGADARRFWYDEYLLNAYIGSYPKPYVALMDGIVMGGGVGVAPHGSVRIATDTTKMAMPEVGIGFIPDVGGTYLLRHGLRVRWDCTPHSPVHRSPGPTRSPWVSPITTCPTTSWPPSPSHSSPTASRTPWPPTPSNRPPAHCWTSAPGSTSATPATPWPTSSPRWAAMTHPPPANKAAKLIATRSPIALAVTLEAVRRAAKLETLEDVLRQEYRTSCASVKSHDFVEGIRAQLVDKDRNPQWSPASIAAVTPADVEAYFVPAEPDLTFQEETK